MNHLRIAAVALAAATLALPASDVAAQPARPTVTITLASHYFQPSPIYLAGGVPVRLVFVNQSGKTHEFDAPEFFAAARILSGNAPAGEIELQKGRSTTIDLVPARGRYKVHCGQPFHTMLGMKTTVVVS
jgi:uncharacterized cupredoxin-like copper-binding protein